MPEKVALMIDDTENCTKDELAAFKASLSPSLKAEAEARIKAVNDSFDDRRKKSAA